METTIENYGKQAAQNALYEIHNLAKYSLYIPNI